MYEKKAIVIAGATASGKTSLAIEMSKEYKGIIINADSMQIYKELQIITARPSREEESLAEHRLYGIISGKEDFSVAKWCEMAAVEMKDAWSKGKIPIITGGTGLYINSLMRGLSPVPEIPEEIRAQIRESCEAEGIESLYSKLQEKDPVIASKLKPADKQRICRALEVVEATGKPLSKWQDMPPKKTINADYFTVLIKLPREELYKRCNLRFEKMVYGGAIEEVEKLLKEDIAEDMPVRKALGVPELAEYLKGNTTIDEAIEKGKQSTRNYAKRQTTWFRNQLNPDLTFDTEHKSDILKEILI